MLSSKALTVLNLTLGITAFLLLLNLLGATLPSVGQALYALDSAEAVCVTNYKNNYNLMHPDLCCSELQQQLVKGADEQRTLKIGDEEVTVDKHYYTSLGTIGYFVNNKAYRYCRNNGFLV